jgi:hypothetical protein
MTGVKSFLKVICPSVVYELFNLSPVGGYQLVIGERLPNCQRFKGLTEPTTHDNLMARALR